MSNENKLWLMILLVFLAGFGIAIAKADTATFYADKFNGQKTANGEIFSQSKLTCASNKYKFGTKLKVTNLANNKSVVCKVNDTGGFGKNTVDLSKAAFGRIAPLAKGRVMVKIEVIK